MSGTVKLICVLLLIPFLAAIGHDFHFNYLSDPEKKAKLEAFEIEPEGYQISDLGFIMVNYTPELYDNLRASFDEQTWKTYADPVLQQYTFLIALIPAAVFYLYLLIARLVHLPPFRDAGGGSFKSGSFSPGKKTPNGKTGTPPEGKFKYNRR